ncbi:unnamed protein product [Agarophyton chilense]
MPKRHEQSVIYGPQAAQRVTNSSVLLVGAGGVGCEPLKDLAIAGHHRCVQSLSPVSVPTSPCGKSKATGVAKTLSTIAPDTNITPIMANINQNDFDVNFFRGFTLVCTALDSLEARRHVNRMCLAANIPLVESASTGYNGQASVSSNGVECYDCVVRTPPKAYAVCPIPSTPD